MKKNQFAGITYDTLTLEGALFTSDIVQKILTAQGAFQDAKDYNIPLGLSITDEVGRSFQIAQALRGAEKNGMSLEKFTGDFFRDCLSFTPEDFAETVNTSRDDAHWEIRAGKNRNGEYTARLFRPQAALGRPAFVEFNLQTILDEKRFPDYKMLWLFFHSSRSRSRNIAGQTGCIWDAWKKEGEESGIRARDNLRVGVTAALTELGQGFLADTGAGNDALRQKLLDGGISSAAYFAELLRLMYRFLFLITIEERGLLFEHDTKEIPDDAERRSLEGVHDIYHSGYSLRRLRDRSLRFHRGNYSDIGESLKIVWAALAKGERRLDLPSLGGLFAADMCPNLDRCSIANAAILEAMRNLRWTYDGNRLMLIDYKNLDVEELGSVYESLLELEPRLNVPRGEFSFEGSGGSRKTTGSYYTDESLVLSLIKSNLDPLIQEKLEEKTSGKKEALTDEQKILSITVIDPSCGSGHFLLAAARRLAERLAHIRHGEITDANYRAALRDIIASGIYGVDLNPLAVELARMALWLEGYEPGKPLSFLDHHIRCGNALVGVLDFNALAAGIPDDAYKTLSGDESEAAKEVKKQNKKEIEAIKSGQNMLFTDPIAKIEAKLTEFHWRLENANNDSLENVEKKRRLFADILAGEEYRQIKKACDLYVAAFYAEKKKNLPIPTTADVNRAVSGQEEGQFSKGVNALAACIAGENRVFHWRLEFPEVFQRGGFDCVLGNPPWERIKLQEEEFFAPRSPEIADAANKAKRDRMIGLLPQGSEYDQQLYRDFIQARRNAEAASAFAHVKREAGGRFPLTGVGDVNTYALFAETILHIKRGQGRAGFIVPTGIATDDSTKQYFARISGDNLVSLYDFENREKIFPDVDSRMKFSLVSLGKSDYADLAFFLTNTHQLADKRRHFQLARDEFRLLNPNTQTCPVFRSEKDAELTKKIYRNVPVLVREKDVSEAEYGNPWGIRFMAMFHMSNDSGLFHTEPASDRLPLYEAKMMHQFDHRWTTYDSGDTVDVTVEQKRDSGFTVRPRYWVDRREVLDRLTGDDNATTENHDQKKPVPKWLMGWRRISNTTNERTLISSIIPVCGVGDSIFLWFSKITDIKLLSCFYADQNTLVHDFCTRQKIGGTNISFYYMEQLPVLPPHAYFQDDIDFIVPRVLELTYTTGDLIPFAEDLWDSADSKLRLLFLKQRHGEKAGDFRQYASCTTAQLPPETGIAGILPPFAFDKERRSLLRSDLDACYARLYGLTRDDLRYILDPADLMGEGYPSETFRVLKDKELAEYGEYRTRRLVLAAWDRESEA